MKTQTRVSVRDKDLLNKVWLSLRSQEGCTQTQGQLGTRLGSQGLFCYGLNCVPKDAQLPSTSEWECTWRSHLPSYSWRLGEPQSNLNDVLMRSGNADRGFLGAQRDFHMKRNQEGCHLRERDKFTPTGTTTSGYCG